MNVAHVTSTFPPYWAGTGNVAFHNARIIHERGHNVTLFTAANNAGTSYKTPYKTHYLPAFFRIGNAPLTPSLFNHLQGFDLIHLHYPYIFGAELVLAAARRRRIPLVLTYHNQLQESQLFKRTLFSVYNLSSEPFLLRACDLVLAVSEGHLRNLHPELAKRTKVAELPNGVDTAMFRPQSSNNIRAELGTPPEAPVALFVGALDQAHRFKNVDGLLRAFAELELPDAELWIIGEGDLKAQLESLCQTLALKDTVRFLGKHPPTALPPYYAAADVTVLPSTGVESFGVVLIESMACGTPVIASALPGVSALVREGEDGVLVPPGSLSALTEALTAMLQNRKRAAAMGCEGLSKVRARYDWRMVGAQLEALYEQVLTGGAR